MPTLFATVHGIVQGVGFRYFASRRGRELGLRGYAQNCADGTVEVVAEGPQTELERFLALLREGPASSRVEKVDHRYTDAERGLTRFDVA